MTRDNKLYTWVDVQDLISTYFKSRQLESLDKLNIRIYWDGITINFCKPLTSNEIESILEEIFLSRLLKDASVMSIQLEGNRRLLISLEEVGCDEILKLDFKPTLSRPSFIGPKQSIDYTSRDPLESPTIYAFHSFKGGVGRTLHAIAMALNLSERKKVLLIDADFEAPGISWLSECAKVFLQMLQPKIIR